MPDFQDQTVLVTGAVLTIDGGRLLQFTYTPG